MTGPKERARAKRLRALADAAWALSLILFGWRFFAPLEQVAAIELWDETAYMLRGLRLPLTAWPGGYGPLYSLFYRLLAGVEPEPLRLYYLAYRVGALLLPLAVYWALRRAEACPWFAGPSAWLVLTARGNAVVWPRVSNFALAWLLFGLGLVWGARERAAPWRWAAAGVVLWTAAYIRPEMAAAALLTWAVAAWLAWRARRRGRALGPRGLAWYGLLAGVALPLVLWGAPLQPGRSWDAFAQHFTVRRAQMGDDIPDPWRGAGIRPTIARYFGPEVRSIPAAVRANPGAVAAHIRANAQAALHDRRLRNLIDVPWSRVWAATRSRLLFGLGLGGLVWAVRLRRGRARARLRLLLAGPVPWLALALLPPLGSMLFIFPHAHYGWIVAVLGLVLAALLVTPTRDDAPRSPAAWWPWLGVSLNLMLLGALASRTAATSVQVWLRPARENAVPALAAFARGLDLSGPVPVLGAEGGLDLYLGPDFVSVDDALIHSEAALLDFIAQQRVRMLIFQGDDPGATYFCRGHEHECAALLAQPRAWGFRPRWISLAEGSFLVLVAED